MRLSQKRQREFSAKAKMILDLPNLEAQKRALSVAEIDTYDGRFFSPETDEVRCGWAVVIGGLRLTEDELMELTDNPRRWKWRLFPTQADAIAAAVAVQTRFKAELLAP
jgi:hypothetical protein